MSYGKQTTSEMIRSGRIDPNGRGLDLSAEEATRLAWAGGSENIIVSGSTDFTTLSGLRGAVLKLKQEFFSSGSGIVIAGDQR